MRINETPPSKPADNNENPPSKPGEYNENPPAKPDGDDKPGVLDNEGIYEYIIENSRITYQTAVDEAASETALSLAHGHESSGVKNGMFYRTQHTGNHKYTVKLLKSGSLYNRLFRTSVYAAVILVLGAATVMILSVIISKIVIKPVAENEQKQ